METFIVRVWGPEQPGDSVPDGVLRGVVRHVGTGRESTFATWEELRGTLAGPAAAAFQHPAVATRGEGEAPR